MSTRTVSKRGVLGGIFSLCVLIVALFAFGSPAGAQTGYTPSTVLGTTITSGGGGGGGGGGTGGSDLPRTGFESGTLTSLAIVLLVVGVALVLTHLARRRRLTA